MLHITSSNISSINDTCIWLSLIFFPNEVGFLSISSTETSRPSPQEFKRRREETLWKWRRIKTEEDTGGVLVGGRVKSDETLGNGVVVRSLY